MLFLCIHTHTVDRCLAGKPEEGKKVRSDLIANFKKEGIKVLGYYSAPNEHAGYYVFDADDIRVLQRAIMPLTLWGTSRLIPVYSNDDFLQALK
jgi:hypothetical protein